MDAMTDHERKKRKPPRAYRVPVELEDELERRLERSGLSFSAFVTQAWYGKPAPRQQRRPPVEEKLIAKLLVKAAAVADRANELKSVSVDSSTVHLLEKILEELRLIRVAIFKMLGRKP